MLHQKTILIVENDAYVALDLATAVERHRGTVAGPVATADDALEVIANTPVTAAIIDAHVANVAALAHALDQARVPSVFQADSIVPAAVKQWVDPTTLLFRPVDSAIVVSMIAIAIDRADQDSD